YTSLPPPVISSLSLHDALPISSAGACSASPPGTSSLAGLPACRGHCSRRSALSRPARPHTLPLAPLAGCLHSAIRRSGKRHLRRSEEHTSELQSLTNLVCRLLL